MRFVAIALLVGCGSGQPPPTSPAPADRNARPAALSVETRYFDNEVTYEVSGQGVELASLPVAAWLGLPWSGRASIDVQVRVPLASGAEDWSRAEGAIKVSCERCQMGDDRAKLPVSGGGAFAGDGIDFGHLGFSHITAEVKLSGGNAELTTWKLASADIQVELAGRVSLMPKLDESHVEACVRFSTTPALAKRDPRTSAVLGLTGGAVAADGMYNIRVSGPFAAPRRLAQVCDGSQPTIETPGPGEPHTEYTDLDEALDKGVTKVTDTTYGVSLGLLDKLFEDPATVAKGARIVPSMKNGRADGYKLYAIRPTSVFAKLGFSNGDTVTAIGGEPVTDADKLLEIYAKLRDLKQGAVVSVEITRRGKPLTLTYTLER